MPQSQVAVSASALRDARQAAGLSVQTAAEKIGVARSALASWEAGQYQPVISSLHSLASLYGVAYIDLLTGDLPIPPLARLRVVAGLLQRDVGEYLGVSGSHYGMVERGRRAIPNHWLQPLSELYGAPVESIRRLTR